MNNHSSSNIQIKKILEDIIGNAFPDSDRLDDYKRFFFEISDKNITSYAGAYFPEKKKIVIVGLNRESKHIVITCLHELSHHIDCCNRGKSDHGKEFYSIYQKLLYAALNMKVFTPADATMEDVTDSNKIRNMLKGWVPSYIDYKKDEFLIRISNSYDLKEILKMRGYKYDSLGKTWNLTLIKNKTNEEIKELKALGVDEANIAISPASDFNIQAKLKIVASGKKTYESKDLLKEYGFTYKNKEWTYYLKPEEDINVLLKKLQYKIPGVKFTYSS